MRIIVLLSLASLPDSAAFLSSFRVDGSSQKESSQPWRLEYFDCQAQEMQLYTDSVSSAPEEKHYRSVSMVETEYDASNIQSFESQYQGLTNPSKAALVLAVMIGVGMVAASPEMDYSAVGVLESRLESLQNGIGPIFQENLPLIPSEFDYQVAALWQKSGMKDLDYQPQGIYTGGSLQASFEHFAGVVASKIDVLKSSSQVLQDSFTQATRSLCIKGVDTTNFFRETIASKMQHLQGLWVDNSERIKSSIIEPAVMRLSESRAAFESWQSDTNIQMLRQGTGLHEKISSAWQAKIKDDTIIPLQQAWAAFHDSFDGEIIREISFAEIKWKEVESFLREQTATIGKWNYILHSTVPEHLFRNQNELYSRANDLNDLVVTEMIRIVSSLTEWVRHNTFEVLTKAEELPARIMGTAEMRTNEGQALLSKELDQVTKKIAVNVKEWQSFTDAQVLDGKIELAKRLNAAMGDLQEAKQTMSLQIALVSDSIMTGLTAARHSMTTYQDEVDVRILRNGAILRDSLVRERANVDGFVTEKLGSAQKDMVDPLLSANREFWASFETILNRDVRIGRETLEASASNAKAFWDSSSSSFGTIVVPKATHQAESFFEGTKISIFQEAAKIEGFLNGKAGEVRALNVPEVIKSWSTSVKVGISSTSANLFNGIVTFCQLLGDAMVTKYVALQKGAVPTESGSLTPFSDNAEHLMTIVAESGHQGTGAAILVGAEMLPTVATKASTTLDSISSVDSGNELVQQTTLSAGATIADQYERLQKSLFDGFN